MSPMGGVWAGRGDGGRGGGRVGDWKTGGGFGVQSGGGLVYGQERLLVTDCVCNGGEKIFYQGTLLWNYKHFLPARTFTRF